MLSMVAPGVDEKPLPVIVTLPPGSSVSGLTAEMTTLLPSVGPFEPPHAATRQVIAAGKAARRTRDKLGMDELGKWARAASDLADSITLYLRMRVGGQR
ncbi:MAG TPA: hypothetical protein VN607_14190 [Gemmatimonadaceae bacterium]|nr:hypothetical protein [Gemmatimonadaceae bacterium]